MIDLFTSLTIINGVIPDYIIQALMINVNNQAVNKIVILTESEEEDVRQYAPVFSDKKVDIHHVPVRPTFGDLVNAINTSMGSNKGIAAIINADISLDADTFVAKISSVFDSLSAKYKRLALCLTRYDLINGAAAKTLVDYQGLPNIMSSDCWVFDRPIEIDRDLYYSLGQMFCDKYLCHDLVVSGYEVFNPCLDCIVLHHEIDVKGHNYYQDLIEAESTQDSLKRHWRTSVTNSGCYFGVPHVSSSALIHGYEPKAISRRTNRKRIFVNALFSAEDGFSLDSYVTHFLNGNEDVDTDVFFLVSDSAEQDRLIGILSNICYRAAYVLIVIDVKQFFFDYNKEPGHLFLCREANYFFMETSGNGLYLSPFGLKSKSILVMAYSILLTTRLVKSNPLRKLFAFFQLDAERLSLIRVGEKAICGLIFGMKGVTAWCGKI